MVSWLRCVSVFRFCLSVICVILMYLWFWLSLIV